MCCLCATWPALTAALRRALCAVAQVFCPIGIAAGVLGWGATVTFFTVRPCRAAGQSRHGATCCLCALSIPPPACAACPSPQNFLVLIPLAMTLGDVTEDLALRLGDVAGGLLNATFGNVTELVLSIAALRQGLLDVVADSLLGSILSNLLLVLGEGHGVPWRGAIRTREQCRRATNAVASGWCGAARGVCGARAQAAAFCLGASTTRRKLSTPPATEPSGAHAANAGGSMAAYQGVGGERAWRQGTLRTLVAVWTPRRVGHGALLAPRARRSMLFLSSIGIALPTAAATMISNPDRPQWVLQVSRGVAVVLLLCYVSYLVFQLYTHHDLFDDMDCESVRPPGPGGPSALLLGARTPDLSGTPPPRHVPGGGFLPAGASPTSLAAGASGNGLDERLLGGVGLGYGAEEEEEDAGHELPVISATGGVVALALISALVALHSE